MIFFDIVIIVFLFSLFGFLHTFLARSKIKKTLVEKIGAGIAFYRLFYNIFSTLIFIVVCSIAPKPDVIIYELNYPYDIIIFALQVISLFGLLWAVSVVDLKEFTGVAQVLRLMNNEYDMKDVDEKMSLQIKGPFKFVRHPIYFFSILFLALRPAMSLFYLVTFVCITIYFIIGSYCEEEKLIERFGGTYIQYQKKVPRIFPRIIKTSETKF